MTTVESPAAKSLIIITSLRFHRSTNAPAIGASKTDGAKVNVPTRASAVAEPVICQAQIVSANWVMAVPTNEITCPNHTTVKAAMPVGRFDSFMCILLDDGLSLMADGG